jgi:acetyltransferase-like isoleucine patch superfamily enzyme
VLDGNGDAPATIRIADNAIIGRNTILTCKGGQIEIGPNTNLSANCEIHSRSRVSVGADVLFAAHCYLVGGQHKFDRLDVPVIEQGTAAEGIHIGNGCWLGTTVTVTDGVEIGDNTVIGAHSLVNRSLPAGVIAFGTPAKVVRQRDDAGHLPQKQ